MSEWPAVPIAVTHIDQGTDSPQSARADLKLAIDAINEMIAGAGVTQSGKQIYVAAGGTSTVITAALTPTPATLYDGMIINLKMASTAVDGTASLPSINLVTTAATGARWACKPGGGYIRAQDWKAGDIVSWAWNQTNNRWELKDQRAGLKVSANDTRPGYLNGKLVAGSNVTLVEGADGGDETLTISAAGGLVLLNTMNVSGGPTSLVWLDIFTATYRNYLVVFDNLKTGNSVCYTGKPFEISLTTASTDSGWSTFISDAVSGAAASRHLSGHATIYSPFQPDAGVIIRPVGAITDTGGGARYLDEKLCGGTGADTQYKSLRLRMGGDAFTEGVVSVYGFQK